MTLKVLDLFSGREGWSAAFYDRGHEVVTLDVDPKFEPDICVDIMDVTNLGRFDVILASPPCTCFTIQAVYHNWVKTDEGEYLPRRKKAFDALQMVIHALTLIEESEPLYWWMENPRAMLRKLLPDVGIDLPMVTISQCQYGREYMKPTDLWGDWPWTWKPRPMCSNGDPCHVSAPRGSSTGSQGRDRETVATIPYELSKDVCVAVEQATEMEA